MQESSTPFLTARWTNLAMLNYEVDPAVLAPYVPAGTELDSWQGHTFASIVGFLFLDTLLLGLPVPGHRNFEELNLRFYVRRQDPEGWRRGVVFVKEIVPRPAIALVARLAYGENYVAHPMSHLIENEEDQLRTTTYTCWSDERRHELRVVVDGPPALPPAGSAAEFITEHYWGYARGRDGRTVEYQVTHPQWSVYPVRKAHFDADIAALYGPQFVPFLQEPASAFVAAGSVVTVMKGQKI